jgi:hypothetical protein
MRVVVFVGFLFVAMMANASTEKSTAALGDRVAPEPGVQRILPPAFASRENFYAGIKAKLEEADMRLDNLRLDGPDSVAPRLAKIDEELQSLHDVINNLSSVRDSDLKSLEKKVAANFNSLENRLSKIESEIK